tara:strand:- start:25 stop:480 length:456 start_codon:yes stop_codon:yes gene_type:complete
MTSEKIDDIYELSIEDLMKLDNIKLDKMEYASSLCFTRAERFVEGLYVRDELINLCKKYFGNCNILMKNGLVKQYNKLKEEVVNKNLIGLILVGLNLKDIVIDEYLTLNQEIIELTVKSISVYLIKEYFTKEEVVEMCKKTPNFNIYYKND